jgi:hypothetical protein
MKASMELVAAVAKMAQTAKFASLTYVSKETGERARYTIILNGNYQNVLENSLLELEIQRPSLSGLAATACDELIASVKQSIESHAKGEQNPAYTKKNQYFVVAEAPALKVSLVDGTMEISGLAHAKVVLEEGEPRKPVNSKPLTIEKNRLRKQLAIGKFRTFAVENLEGVRLNGETLEFS